MTALGDALRVLVPDVALRDYPALLSTETEARSWARQGAPDGALVVADYQASPRGRDGFDWDVPTKGICFSLIIRPRLLGHEAGRLYLAGTTALANGEDRIYWPDRILRDGIEVAAVSSYTEIVGLHIDWAVLTLRIDDAEESPARTTTLAIRRIRGQLALPPADLAGIAQRASLVVGRSVTAYLMPTGPSGKVVNGIVDRIDHNGGLVVKAGTRTYVVAPDAVAQLELMDL